MFSQWLFSCAQLNAIGVQQNCNCVQWAMSHINAHCTLYKFFAYYAKTSLNIIVGKCIFPSEDLCIVMFK